MDYETWDLESLDETFKQIAHQTQLDAKFCFFIDGLDEYDGEEKDMSRLPKSLAISGHIKICASSRPGRHYERFLERCERSFDIARFTQERHDGIH